MGGEPGTKPSRLTILIAVPVHSPVKKVDKAFAGFGILHVTRQGVGPKLVHRVEGTLAGGCGSASVKLQGVCWVANLRARVKKSGSESTIRTRRSASESTEAQTTVAKERRTRGRAM
jgi:hypothetical protein